MVLFCDTDSELSFATIRKYGLEVIKMPYIFRGEELFPDENMDMHEFFEAMRNGEVPTTAAINVQNYIDYFTPYFEKGEDILYVSFGTPFSHTFEAMNIAIEQLKAEYPSVRFEWFDTKCISMATGIIVYAAAKLYREGKSIDKIVSVLKDIAPKANCLIAVDDLVYLKRGGRVSTVAAAVATMLNLKPILRIPEDGVLEVYQKKMGRKQSIQFLVEEVCSQAVMTDRYPIVVLHADCNEECDRVIEKIKSARPDADVWKYEVGPVIGAHCGPNTIGICFFGNERIPSVKK